MGLKVIGAGFGRTATLSLKAALEQLGFGKCHHMAEVGGSRQQSDYWYAISKGEKANWDQVFKGYQASCDFPSSVFWEELYHHFPDSKVILTLRDPNEWYESAAETIYPLSTQIPTWLKWLIPGLRKNHYMINAIIWQGLFGGSFEDKAHAIRVYNAHTENVIQKVDSTRLLVFDPKQGWEPLCQFLGVPLPKGDFPHLNKSASMQSRLKALKILKLRAFRI